ncbi:MAG: Ig-like domain-containing protein, partial [Acidimicrobiales bacterium]
MIQHLRSRLRVVVATAICALVAAPALVTGTATIAAAAPPGINTATLTVNGAGPATGAFPWHINGGAYNELKAALANANNFGPNGVFKKGSYTVPAAPITDDLSFPGTLSGLDVFFGGLPTDEYTSPEITALQAFNADGRALVLNSNTVGFGDIAAALGFNLRSQRAFFGEDAVCGWTNNNVLADVDSAPARSTAIGSHAIQSSPFGAAPTVTNYHTVQVFSGGLPAQAQSLYSLSVSGQTPQLAVTGPIGETTDLLGAHVSFQAAYVTGTVHITTAALTPSGIFSVAFYHDDANNVLNLISTDTTYPYEADWNTAAVAPAGAADGVHPVIARVTRTVGAGGGTFDATLDFGLDVHNTAPTPPANTAHIDYDCPGANVTRGTSLHSEIVDNNISGTTVAVIPAKSLPGGTNGPIVVTSDLDSMSSAFGSSWTQNRTFTLNAFAWIMDTMLPDVPDDTYFPLTNPVR